jgi:hypothetical protein
VFGEGSNTNGNGYGVHGRTPDVCGYGVFGENLYNDQDLGALDGKSGCVGAGIRGQAVELVGVEGISLQGTGVSGLGGSIGVFGSGSIGVYGTPTVQSPGGTLDPLGATAGVVGQGPVGVLGRATSIAGPAIHADGDLQVVGAPTIAQPHPTDPGLALRFVCLEGNESGTYFRGSARLQNGVAELSIPEEWRLATDVTGITVQVTPTSGPASLWVAVKTRDRIVVRGQPDCTFDYFVNGVRRGFTAHDAIVPNTVFRPALVGMPYGEHLPAGLRQLLVQSGILNADFTPNEETASRLGWTLRLPTTQELEQHGGLR